MKNYRVKLLDLKELKYKIVKASNKLQSKLVLSSQSGQLKCPYCDDKFENIGLFDDILLAIPIS